MKIIESGSSLGVFRTCRKKYEFEYVQLLKPKGYRSALEFGTLVHWLVEQYNKYGSYHPQRYLEFAMKQHKPHWHQDSQEEFAFDKALAEKIVPIWHKYWSSQQGELSQSAMKFRTVEGEWAFGLNEKYIHVGKRDGDFMHRSYEKPFLYELKTASASSDENYVTRLSLDHQISSNVLALKTEDVNVAGTMYDVIYKHALRQKKEESSEAFLERIRADYEAHQGEYFKRLLVPRTPKHLKEYAKELESTFKDIESGVIYRNTSACMQHNSLCPYWQLCLDDDSPEIRSKFAIKPNKFEELEKANHL
jgi:hypothetical protein